MPASPLPASSRLLRDRRYEAGVLGAKNERGGRPTIATGRFTSLADAQAWADAEHPDAEVVSVTFYSARAGWRPQAAGVRRAGGWS